MALPPQVVEMLRLHREAQEREQQNQDPGWNPSGLVFLSDSEAFLNYDAIRWDWTKLLRRVGSPHMACMPSATPVRRSCFRLASASPRSPPISETTPPSSAGFMLISSNRPNAKQQTVSHASWKTIADHEIGGKLSANPR